MEFCIARRALLICCLLSGGAPALAQGTVEDLGSPAPDAGPGTPETPPSDAAPPDAAPQEESATLPEAPLPGPTAEPSSESPSSLAAEGSSGTTPLRLIVIDAAAYAIDPVVGEHVTAQMRDTGSAIGYEVLDRPSTVAAAQQLRMPYPPAPANLWQVTYIASCARGAFARVWAHEGKYVIEITVASLDGTGPWFARGTAGAEDLHERTEALLREALPTPDTWRGPDESSRAPMVVTTPSEPSVRETTGAYLPQQPVLDEPITRRWGLAAQVELAFGISSDSYINGLVGARLDYRVSSELIFGAYLGYANLRGRNGRASNLLPYLQVEDRVRVTADSDITIPLRFGLGYLPFNGPFVRLAAGVNFPVGENVQVGVDIIAPTFWVLPDRTTVSLDVATEILWRP